jgi:hypothetical protein
MRNRARRNAALYLVVATALGACQPASEPTTTTTPAASTTTTSATTNTTGEPGPTTTTSAPDSTTSTPAEETVEVLLAPFTQMGSGWSEQVFPYGEGEDTLGTSPGGEGLMLGPEYGTQTPDGSWWFLDAARLRLAHFDGDGAYLDQVVLPEDILVDGQYFQFQMPQGLDDGSVVAFGFRSEDATALLRVAEGTASQSTYAGAIPLETTDGELLYGFSLEDRLPRALDPGDPVPEVIEFFRARDGSNYLVRIVEDQVLVALPDAGSARVLQMRFSEDPTVSVRGNVEVETGTDGSLFLLMYGAPESDESLGAGGFVSIGPNGVVSDTEPIVDPFSLSDPGSPAHLGVTPGTSTPWMMVVGEDGVHVHIRTG